MSESIPIFSHTTASGSITSGLLPARAAFVRATNLPANWKTVRIALLYSLRGADAASSPVVETAAATANLLTQAQIGLSNGAGMPGLAGVRFVGVGSGTNATTDACVSNYSSAWRLLTTNTTGQTYATLGGRVCNGTAVAYQGSSARSQTTAISTPLGTTNFAECLTLELSVVTAATLTMQFAIMRPLAPATQAEVGVALEKAITTVTGITDNTAGGWWSSSVAVDCTTLFVRLPFINNRLVIHGYKVAQVA